MFAKNVNSLSGSDLYIYGKLISAKDSSGADKMKKLLANTCWITYRRNFPAMLDLKDNLFRTDAGEFKRMGVCDQSGSDVFLQSSDGSGTATFEWKYRLNAEIASQVYGFA